jgi:hypothetical protein
VAPDFAHKIIEQAYKAADESPGAAESFKREYRAKHGGQTYRTCNAPGVTAVEPRELPWRNAALSGGTSTPR